MGGAAQGAVVACGHSPDSPLTRADKAELHPAEAATRMLGAGTHCDHTPLPATPEEAGATDAAVGGPANPSGSWPADLGLPPRLGAGQEGPALVRWPHSPRLSERAHGFRQGRRRWEVLWPRATSPGLAIAVGFVASARAITASL